MSWPKIKDQTFLPNFEFKAWEKNHQRCRSCRYRTTHDSLRIGCNYNVVENTTRMAQDKDACMETYFSSENCPWYVKGKRIKTSAEPLRLRGSAPVITKENADGKPGRRVRKVQMDEAGAICKEGADDANVHACGSTKRRWPDPRTGFDRIRDPRGLLVQAARMVYEGQTKGGRRKRPVMKLNSAYEVTEIFGSQYEAARALTLAHRNVQLRMDGKVVEQFRSGYALKDARDYFKWLEEQGRPYKI